jgi:hypothetical protein
MFNKTYSKHQNFTSYKTTHECNICEAFPSKLWLPSDNGQYLPKHVKVLFYYHKTLLHLMEFISNFTYMKYLLSHAFTESSPLTALATTK